MADMTTMPAFDAQSFGIQQMPLPRRLYDSIISAGLLTKEDKVELIHGQLITKMPIGTKHARMVTTLSRLLFGKIGHRAMIAAQNPVALHEYSEPEPDLTIAKLPEMAYDQRHPEPADIFFLIEVADSSLRFDREGKVPLYAACDIAETWLVDVLGQTLTVFSQPTASGYQQSVTYKSGDSFRISMFPEVEIKLSELGW